MEINEIVALVQALNKPKIKAANPLPIGSNVFIRTVTHYYTGNLNSQQGQWLILTEAAWIADTGRFHDFLKDGKCNEYESFPDNVMIPVGSIIDITVFRHKLFSGQK